MLTRQRDLKVWCGAEGDPNKRVDSPVELVKWGGRLTSRKQFVRGISLATFFALGGNFLGVSSFLLSLDEGQLAQFTKLDVLIPVNAFRRCWNPDLGFEFQYNGEWLADQRLIRRAAERIEAENPIDLPPLTNKKRKVYSMDPVAAFGPAGSEGEENVSVIVAPAAPGFTLRNLGSAKEAATKLLENTIAPEGSGKSALLIDATERLNHPTVSADSTAFLCRVDGSGVLYYVFEYTVKSTMWFRHNVAIFGTKSEKLYTLNAQTPEEKWDVNRTSFYQTAKSFRIY